MSGALAGTYAAGVNACGMTCGLTDRSGRIKMGANPWLEAAPIIRRRLGRKWLAGRRRELHALCACISNYGLLAA